MRDRAYRTDFENQAMVRTAQDFPCEKRNNRPIKNGPPDFGEPVIAGVLM